MHPVASALSFCLSLSARSTVPYLVVCRILFVFIHSAQQQQPKTAAKKQKKVIDSDSDSEDDEPIESIQKNLLKMNFTMEQINAHIVIVAKNEDDVNTENGRHLSWLRFRLFA